MGIIDLPPIKGLFAQPIALEHILDKIPLGIVLLNLHRRIVFLNQGIQALTGFSNKEARGIPCYNILRSKICIQRCPALNINKESESSCVESDLINRDRQLIPIRITTAPIKDMQGKVAGILETIEDIRPLRELDEKMSHAYSFGPLVGKSPQIEKIFQILPVIAQSDSSILITGETGTGKDIVAEAIHQASNRVKGSFIKVNCGALPESLLESELFGHTKGAFTGAVENKHGRFRLAHNGTLYLTEVGDIPLPLQVKLLTFLDDKVVYPLGSTKGFHADTRVIAATHRNLEQMVREGRFREDLLFRLNVARIHLPPLREREDDIRLLLDHFLNAFTPQFRKNIKGFFKKTLDILLDYPYPGNVRELRNIVEYAVNICQEEQIKPKHLPAYLTEKTSIIEAIRSNEDRASLFVRPEPNKQKGQGQNETWPSMERRMIMEALMKTRGRRNKAAHMLGWGRSTLWRKMKQYEIDS